MVTKSKVTLIQSPHGVTFEKIKLARWEDTYHDGDWHCSKCGAIVEKDEQDRHNWFYCYHCGSPMDLTKGEVYGVDQERRSRKENR